MKWFLKTLVPSSRPHSLLFRSRVQRFATLVIPSPPILTVSVLEVTLNGKMTRKSLTKSNLLEKSQIHTRDLISLLSFERKRANPDLMVRDSAIVVCFSRLRAIIQYDRVFLLNPELDYVRGFIPNLISHLETPPKQVQLSNPYESSEHEEVDFELKVLEAILSYVCETYRRRAMFIYPLVDSVTNRLSEQSDHHDLLHQLLPMRDHLSTFEIELDGAEDVLDSLLKNDEDLVGLLLTERKRLQGQMPPLEAHRTVELMLENYTSQFVDIGNEAYFLRKRIESIQSVAELNLASQRNRLLHVTLRISLASLSIATMTASAGFFGMNLHSGLENESPLLFGAVVSTSCVLSLIMFFMMRFHFERKTLATPSSSAASSSGSSRGGYDAVFQNLDEIQTVLGNGDFVRKQAFQKAMASLAISEDISNLLWESRRRNHSESKDSPELRKLFDTSFIQREKSFSKL